MDNKALHVRHVGQQREDLQVVDEGKGFLAAALDVKGKDGCAAVGEILLVQSVIRVIRQRGVVHLFHLRVVSKELHHLFGVLHMTLDAQAQRLGALQQQEGVEGGDGSAGITQQDGADVGDESGRACGIRKGDAVVAGVGGSNVGVTVAGLPVEVAAVHDDAAQRGAMAADKLGGRVHHDVCAVLDGTDEVRGAEGVINDQRQAVLVGDGCNGVDIRDVAVGVAQRFQIHSLGIGLDGCFHLCKVVGIHEGGVDAELGQGVSQQVVAAAIAGVFFAHGNVTAVQCDVALHHLLLRGQIALHAGRIHLGGKCTHAQHGGGTHRHSGTAQGTDKLFVQHLHRKYLLKTAAAGTAFVFCIIIVF